MSWQPNFQLGPLGQEIIFPCKAKEYLEDLDNVEVEDRNLLGATYKSYLRVNVPKIQVEFAQLSDSYMAILRGMSAPLNPLNFILNKSLSANYFQAVSSTTELIYIPPMSATGVTIIGVYLASDTYQTGTNYYAGGYGMGGYGEGGYGGGAFDPNGGGTGLGLITLGLALPAAQQAVTIIYTYSGVACFAKITARPHKGFYSSYWQGSLKISGS